MAIADVYVSRMKGVSGRSRWPVMRPVLFLILASLGAAPSCQGTGASQSQPASRIESRSFDTPGKLPVVSFQPQKGRLNITIGSTEFATYVYQDDAIPRPYFANVGAPCGVQVTRNHPPQMSDPNDHAAYHPGIWLAFGDFGGHDYWRLKARVAGGGFREGPPKGGGRRPFARPQWEFCPS